MNDPEQKLLDALDCAATCSRYDLRCQHAALVYARDVLLRVAGDIGATSDHSGSIAALDEQIATPYVAFHAESRA